MITVPKPIKPLPLKTTDLNLWVNGVNTETNALRLGAQALASANNILLDQDGLLRPMPSLHLWGPQPIGTMLGKPQKFVTNDGLSPTVWMISTQVIDGTAIVCIAKPEDDTWTHCTGGTFDTSAACTFTQAAQSPKMLVLNGVDALAYLDLTTVADTPTVTQMEAIDDPTTAPTLTGTGFSGTDTVTVSYAYTVNSTVGETLPSSIASINLPADRTNWSSSQSVAVAAPTLPDGAESWNLYAASTGEGGAATQLFLLAQGLSTSNLTYTDYGTTPSLITSISPPLANSTDGPHAKEAVVIGGVLFCYQNSANPYGVSIGSQIPGYELDFSPSHGGQVLGIAPGSGSLPMVVWNFRDGPGTPEIKCLTQDIGNIGKRHTISQSTLTYNGTQISVWGYQEDYGFNGTVASNSLIAVNNSTYYLAYDGFYQTGTEPQLQNLLDSHNNAIVLSHDDFQSINQAAVGGSDGSVWQNRLYWCVPVGTDHNNQIWTLDLQRGNAWMKPLNIECDGITIITDNSGVNHQVFLVNNQLLESTYQVLTQINGVAFPTSFSTAAIGFSADLRTWSQVIEVLAVLLNAQGTMYLQALAWTDDNQLEEVGSAVFNADAEGLGFGWNEGGYNGGDPTIYEDNLLGWNQFDAPTLTVQDSVDVPITINRRVRYMLINSNSTAINTDYSLSQLIPLFTVVGVENLQ